MINMIHTVTANPALDITYKVKTIKFDDTTRASKVYRAAGGKGINVSRVAARLGHPTIAMGFIGGRAGQEIEDLLESEGVRTWFCHHKDTTRTNTIIQDASGKQIRVSGPGTKVSPKETKSLLDSIFHLKAPDFLTLSGSILKGMPSNFYKQAFDHAKADGIRVAVDADGEELRHAVEAGAHLIKPNHYELERLSKKIIEGIDDALAASREIVAQGVQIVLCSLGPKGAILVTKDEAWHAIPPKVRVDSAVGSGDSLLAGALVAAAEGKTLRDVLKLGVACGTATAMTPGTSLCYAKTIYELLPEVRLEAL
jgi:6-phosphofructokinase 2